ncbi:hypothetical protein HKD37_20G056758 [Glycine soja]
MEKNNKSRMVIQRRLCHSRSLNECLMYLITTRLDILHGASVLTKYLHCANDENFKATKRMFQITSKRLPIMESSMKEINFHGFSDSGCPGPIEDMKSTYRYYFSLGSEIFLDFKEARSCSIINNRSKIYCYCRAINQAIWIRKLLVELHKQQKRE